MTKAIAGRPQPPPVPRPRRAARQAPVVTVLAPPDDDGGRTSPFSDPGARNPFAGRPPPPPPRRGRAQSAVDVRTWQPPPRDPRTEIEAELAGCLDEAAEDIAAGGSGAASYEKARAAAARLPEDAAAAAETRIERHEVAFTRV